MAVVARYETVFFPLCATRLHLYLLSCCDPVLHSPVRAHLLDSLALAVHPPRRWKGPDNFVPRSLLRSLCSLQRVSIIASVRSVGCNRVIRINSSTQVLSRFLFHHTGGHLRDAENHGQDDPPRERQAELQGIDPALLLSALFVSISLDVLCVCDASLLIRTRILRACYCAHVQHW